MAVTLEPGNPIWASKAIKPSRQSLVQTGMEPPWVDPIENAAGTERVDVYVRVDNDAVPVACPVGPWAVPLPFAGHLNANDPAYGPTGGATVVVNNGAWRFTMGTGSDVLTKPNSNVSPQIMPVATSGRKVWGWSPDGHWFAFAYSPPGASGRRWHLVVCALDDAVRLDGTLATPGTIVYQLPSSGPTASLGYNEPNASWVFDETTFGWVGSSGIFTAGTAASGTDLSRYLVNFRMSAPVYVLDQVPTGQQWRYRASPCGAQVALLQEVPSGPAARITWLSTSDANSVRPKQMGTSTDIDTTGPAPGVTTIAHTANGVQVDRGSGGAPVVIDDPDDTEKFDAMTVHVDRVKASTLPTANLGIVLVGAAIAGELGANQSRWVQVPNRVGWAKDTEAHWCLLAQVYDEPALVHRVWDGQVLTPPPFPATTSNRCAQRNIQIL